MTTSDIAQHLGARRYGKSYRARCPVHKSRGLTLSITAMPEGKTMLHCFAGCDQKMILDSLGWSWRDIGSASEARIDPKAAAEAQRIRTAQEAAAWRALVRQYVQKYRAEGYHTYEEDLTTAFAVPQIMAVEGEKPHLQKMLRTAMARIAAYGVCLKMAKP